MSGGGLQLLVLAGIALFLILKLRSVLGTRDGYEPTQNAQAQQAARKAVSGFEVIDGGVDRDILDNIDGNPKAVEALTEMKKVEPNFSVTEFLGGARGAYEMILMSFERGDIKEIEPFLSEDVADSFTEVIAAREDQGLTIEAEFVGVRELALVDAEFDTTTKQAEMKIKFVGELTSVVKDKDGKIIEGDAQTVKRQKDVWTFAREMGANDPNWQLVQTGE
ncbi:MULTISPECIES: Tim44/TimA family putative adaptor protein [Halocynthiibacter]|uniref:Tim44/TimA family putative adaptor protein n=1 Tax=Halocynthiibacter halioticoli TaxID=2986804 RepID=A0AAE3J2G7_9RHOB|nr:MULTISPECIES: Tim44/TimA family putative adaptor protein [Halocynthiibacter]MCV6825620.1 Tim44/TimA family putative adaptor protein [Halocynthiibacter halioticoli]MCW4058621.1 Tim44/TimA family putative adaptor protein [Halocynthiibacter sp. SDUM655004]MDE0591011.1 Tim44/TimA family putative adaptor protein [Halocynthiibacter sp. C4]